MIQRCSPNEAVHCFPQLVCNEIICRIGFLSRCVCIKRGTFGFVYFLFLLCVLLLSCVAQVTPKQSWDDDLNTPGAKLALKEIARTQSDGRTVVTYHLFASGLPTDARYVLWTRLLDSDPRPIANALLNE